MRRGSRLGTGIVWGTVPIGFPISWVTGPGCSWSGYGTTTPNLWVRKKFVKFRQSTQSTGLRPFESIWEFFFSYCPFDLFRNLGNIFWATSGSSVFCNWLFLVYSGVSLETAASFFLFLKVAMILREKFSQQWRLNWSFLFQSTVIISSLLGGKMVSKMQTVWY